VVQAIKWARVRLVYAFILGAAAVVALLSYLHLDLFAPKKPTETAQCDLLAEATLSPGLDREVRHETVDVTAKLSNCFGNTDLNAGYLSGRLVGRTSCTAVAAPVGSGDASIRWQSGRTSDLHLSLSVVGVARFRVEGRVFRGAFSGDDVSTDFAAASLHGGQCEPSNSVTRISMRSSSVSITPPKTSNTG